jgi:hypothetical protein
MKRSYLLFIVLLIVLLTAISCSQKDTERFRGEWNFKAEKLWETNAAGEDKFLRPAEPRVASDGTVFIHDFERHLSYSFDKDGEFKTAFASMGEGPGEVSRYINCFIAGDRVVVASFNKLYCYDFNGAFIESISNNIFERFPLVFLDHQEFYASGMRCGGEGGDGVVLERVGPDGATVIRKYVLSEEEKKVPGMVILGLTPQILLGFDREFQRIYYGRNNTGEIFVAGSGEADTSRFHLPWNRIPVGEEDKRKHFSQHGIDDATINAIVPLLPKELAFYHRIQCLGGAGVCVQDGNLRFFGLELGDRNIFTGWGPSIYWSRTARGRTVFRKSRLDSDDRRVSLRCDSG